MNNQHNLSTSTRLNTIYQIENNSQNRSASYEIELKVTDTIRNLGIPAHFKGYIYLRYAIIYTLLNPDSIHAITKEIYPAVAKKYSTLPSRVERAIRHAIEFSWHNSDNDALTECFSYRVKNCLDRPTNSEVIANLSDKVRLELGLGFGK